MVPRLPWYYGALRFPANRHGGFPCRSPAVTTRLRLSSSLPSGPTPAGGPGALRCGRPHAAIPVESQGVSSSWGTLVRLCRVLGPRRDQDHQALQWTDAAPELAKPRATRGYGDLGALLHGLNARCLRFDEGHCGLRRKTRFRLPARLYRVGLATHRVPTKGFRSAPVTSLPPFPSFTGRKNDTAHLHRPPVRQ